LARFNACALLAKVNPLVILKKIAHFDEIIGLCQARGAIGH